MNIKRWLVNLCVALVLLELALVLLSWILSSTMTDGIRSLLTSEGLRWFFGSFVGVLCSPLLAWLLLMTIAFGALVSSGLLHKPSCYRERMSLLMVAIVMIGYVGIIALLSVLPHAILLSATGTLFPSPFSKALIPFVSFGIVSASFVYGFLSGRWHSLSEAFDSLTIGISRCAPLYVIYLLFIQFYASLRYILG